jgi:hypothetical protein
MSELGPLLAAMTKVRGVLAHPNRAEGPKVRSVPSSRPPVSIEALSWLDEAERAILGWFDECVTSRKRPAAGSIAEQAHLAAVALEKGHLAGNSELLDEVRETVALLLVRAGQILGERKRPRPLPVQCPQCNTGMILVEGFSPAGGWPRCPRCRVTHTNLAWFSRVVSA